MKKKIVGFLALMISVQTLALEMPAHTVVGSIGEAVEVREYPEHVNAVTIVSGSQEKAGGSAFGRLAGYIFGNNREQKKIAMTAPVFQTQVEEGRQMVSFYLPGALEDQPEPTDNRVSLASQSMRVAVLRYKGGWSDDRYRDHLEKLKAAIAGQSTWEVTGKPIWARYDPPFKPWFMRTNEIMLPVAQTGSASRPASGSPE